MKNIITLLALFFAIITISKAESDTLWCKYTYPSSVHFVKFTPDGQYIAVGPSSGIVTIYDVLTGDSIKSYDNSNWLTSLDISPDGTLLATNVHVYNFQTNSVVATLDGGMVKFSSDGNYLITTAGNIYDTKTWNVSGTFPTHATYPDPNGEMIANIDISSDNQYIAISSYMYKDGVDTSSIIRLYQLSNLQVVNEYVLENGAGMFTNVCFSPDGKYLAGVAIDDTVRIWTLSDRTIYKKFGHYGGINAIAFSPDGNYLVEGGGYFKHHNVNIWNINLETSVYTYPHIDVPYDINISKDGSYIAAANASGINVYNAKWNPTSVTDKGTATQTVYPNPTSGLININLDCIKGNQYYYIYDNNGTLLLTQTIISQTTLTIDFSTYQNGIYFLKIYCGNNISTYKIVKEG
jgi:WD40 repeat protein